MSTEERSQLIQERERLKNESLQNKVANLEKRLNINDRLQDLSISPSTPPSSPVFPDLFERLNATQTSLGRRFDADRDTDTESSSSESDESEIESIESLLENKKEDFVNMEESILNDLAMNTGKEDDSIAEEEKLGKTDETTGEFVLDEEEILKKIGGGFFHHNNKFDEPREITEEQLLVQQMEKRMKEAGEMYDKDLEELVSVLIKKSRNKMEFSQLIPGDAKVLVSSNDTSSVAKELEGNLEILQLGYKKEQIEELFTNDTNFNIAEKKIEISKLLRYMMLYPSNKFNDHRHNQAFLDIIKIKEFFPEYKDKINDSTSVLHDKPTYMNIEIMTKKLSSDLLSKLSGKIDTRGTTLDSEFVGEMLVKLLFLRHCMMLTFIYLKTGGMGYEDSEQNNIMDESYSKLSTAYRQYRKVFNFRKGGAPAFHLNMCRYLIIEFFQMYYEIQKVQDSDTKEITPEGMEMAKTLVQNYNLIDLTDDYFSFFKRAVKGLSGKVLESVSDILKFINEYLTSS